MNDLNETLKKILEAPKQTPAKGVSEALSKELERAGQRSTANDLSSQIAVLLKKDLPTSIQSAASATTSMIPAGQN